MIPSQNPNKESIQFTSFETKSESSSTTVSGLAQSSIQQIKVISSSSSSQPKSIEPEGSLNQSMIRRSSIETSRSRSLSAPFAPGSSSSLNLHESIASRELITSLPLEIGFPPSKDLDGKTAFHKAAIQGDLALVIQLLDSGANPFDLTHENQNCYHFCAQYGHFELLRELIKKTQDRAGFKKALNQPDSDGKTPIHLAVWGDPKPEIVSLLLDQGVDPNIQTSGQDPVTNNPFNYTPLHWAAKHGHLVSARILLEQGADLSLTNINQDTPMDLALRWGQDDLVRLFINPSLVFESEAEPSSISDPEGYHYNQFEKAYEAVNPLGQIFHLEKMADLFLLKNNYVQAAHLLNAAYTISKKAQYSVQYQRLILFKLERIEALFLENFLQRKTPFDHRGYIVKYRETLQAIRQKTQELMPEEVVNNDSDDEYEHELLVRHRALMYRRRILGVPQNALDMRLERHQDFVEDLALKITRHVFDWLSKFDKLSEAEIMIPQVQQTLTEGYKELLISLITESMKLMSKEPPPHAVFCLGSMAREEMCPYSDVEFGFFIEQNTPANKEYFRKLTRLIELKIINLGETKFPLIRPKRIEGMVTEGSSIVPSGFSMDIGGLSPLGRPGIFELIGTPEELVQFQTKEWFSKNDAEIILVNAMTRLGFLGGDRHLFEMYETYLDQILDSKIEKLKFSQKFKLGHRQRIREKRALDLMQGYVTEFEPRLDEDKFALRGFDVKRELYRLPHTVINALALYYDIPQKNTFKQLKALKNKKIFSSKGANHLHKLLAQAIQLRIKTHLFYKTEKEILYAAEEGEELASEELFAINSNISHALRRAYQILYPLYRATKAFTTGNLEAFRKNSFCDRAIGYMEQEDEKHLDPSKLESSYEKALALNPNNPDALRAYGNIKMVQGEAEQSLKYHEELLVVLKQKYGDGPNREIGDTLSSLGIAYDLLGELSKAIEHCSQALAMYENLCGAKDSIAITLFFLGVIYCSSEEFSIAIEYFNQALAMQKEIYGTKAHLEIAMTLNGLGSVYMHSGDFSNAIEYYSQALAMSKELLGVIPHPAVAMTLRALGSAYASSGKPSKAVTYCSRALAMYENLCGAKGSCDVADCLISLGEACEASGEFAKMIDYHSQALAMFKELYGTKAHPSIATSLNSLGDAYNSLGESSKAIEFISQALTMRQELWGTKAHPSIATSLNSLGDAYNSLRDFSKATEYYAQALAMRQKIYGHDIHPTVAHSANNLRMAQEALQNQKN